MTAEVAAGTGGSGAHQGESRAHPVSVTPAREPGPGIQPDGSDVERHVRHADALRRTVAAVPLGPAARCGGRHGQQTQADEPLRCRTGTRPTDEVEDGRRRPQAEGEVGQRGVECVAEPRPTQRVTHGAVGQG